MILKWVSFLLLEYRQTKSSTTTRCQCGVESASTILSMILCCAHIITPVPQKVWSHAALKCIDSIFLGGDAFIGTIVTDNESTMRCRLKQNGREKVEAGVAVLEHLPKTIQANKRADHGARTRTCLQSGCEPPCTCVKCTS
jgi:hypothetical protein